MKKRFFFRIFRDKKLIDVQQFDKDQIVIGHNAEVDLDLSHPDISPIHATIEKRDKGTYLCDLGSKTGTLLNGHKVLDHQVASGDIIQLGPFTMEFYLGVPKPQRAPQVAAAVDKGDQSAEVSSFNQQQKQTSSKENSTEVDGEESLPPPPPEDESFPRPFQSTRHHDSSDFVREDTLSGVANEGSLSIITGESFIGKASDLVGKSRPQSKKTFAPASQVSSVRELLEPSKGTTVEVVVAWKDRVLRTYHFTEPGFVRAGNGPEDIIAVPGEYLPGGSVPILRIDSIATVFMTDSMTGEVLRADSSLPLMELQKLGRLTRVGPLRTLQLEQGEMACLRVGGGLEVFVRYIPEVPRPLVAPLFDIGPIESTGFILSAVLSAILGLYTIIYGPTEKPEEATDDTPRRVVFLYKRTAPLPPPPPPEPEKKTPPKRTKVDLSKKEPSKRVAEKKRAQRRAQAPEPSQKQAQARPNVDDAPNRVAQKRATKKRRGGGQKRSPKESANAASKKVDVSQQGLLGVFSNRGTRSKLDQAFSGTGTLQGLADRATGQTGQASDRAGDDLGYGLKGSSRGGKVSTVGIGKVNTTGRSSGQSNYGATKLGGIRRSTIIPGGEEESFTTGIDKEAVRRVVKRHLSELKACYERALIRDRSLFGKVVLEWDIGAGGRVKRVKVKRTSLRNATVEKCMMRRLRSWRFPDPPANQIAVVNYPFVFQSK